MFFDYSLLNRRNGKFSLIWLVVNDRLEYRRRTDKNFREVMAVDVPKTCEDIIRYICAQMPSLGPGCSRPRFSLYLSSMLMAGSVRVYRHQTCFLLSDAAAAFEKLMKTSYMGGCLEDDPVSVRRVTLMVDPLDLVPSGDPFQLGSLYDIDTMLQFGELPPAEPAPVPGPEGEAAGAHAEEAAAGQPVPPRRASPVNPNVARASDITLREEDRTERQQHLLEDFGESLLPHQRPLDQPILDPFLELELELAPAGSRIDPFAPHPPPPPPPPPGVLSPPPRPRAEAASSQEGEQPQTAGRPRVSEPVQHLVLDAAARAVEPQPAIVIGDGLPLLGDELAPPPPPPGMEEQPPPPPPPGMEEQQMQPPGMEEMPPPPPPGDTTLLGQDAAAAAAMQAEIEATPQRGEGAVPPAARPSRRRAPPAADVTIEEPPPPPQQQQNGSQRPSDVSSSLPLPEVPAPPVRLGRRRRLAVDSAIQLDREVLRRRIEEGSYDTMRAGTATEDNAEAPSQRLVPALELLRRPGRAVGGPLARLHTRHCVTRQEPEWSWRTGAAQEPADQERERRQAQEQEHPEPEVQRDRTATMSGTGSLLSASDLPSARSSAAHQLSFVSATTPTAAENLPIITEAQEHTPAGQPTLPPVMEPLLPPPEEQPPPPPMEEQQQMHPLVEEQLMPPPPPPPMEPQPPPMEEQMQMPPPPPPPMEEQPPPPPVEEQQPAGATQAESGRAGVSGTRTQSSEEPAPTQSQTPYYGPSSQFRSATLLPEDILAWLQSASPAGSAPLLFSQLAPPGSCSRLQAAATFAHLLQLHAQGVVQLQQPSAYGDITVRPVEM